jgi:hypothetical protein
LILNQADPSGPWYYAVNSSIRSTVRAASDGRITVYEEFLDLARYSGDQYRQLLQQQIQGKYNDKQIGVVLPVGVTAQHLWLQLRRDLPSVLAEGGYVDLAPDTKWQLCFTG